MQELKGFGLTLKLVDESSAEQVRIWRNNPDISKFMEFKEYISEEMQGAWLQKIQSAGDLFYVIESNQKRIGTIHLSDINRIDQTAEAGIFIGEPSFSGTGITLGASLLLLDFAFITLQLQTVFAKIHQDNKSAEQYNEILGFEKSTPLPAFFNLWKIERLKYLSKRDKLADWV